MKHHQNIRLICFPFSGGSGYAYAQFKDLWPSAWQVYTVTYPGRGSRINEALITSLDELVDDIWLQIKKFTNEKYVLFGHSLGSTIAYLIAHRAVQTGRDLPIHMILSGTRSPRVKLSVDYRYLFSSEKLKAKLKSYGGFPRELLEDHHAFSFFEKIIRADFQAIETWTYQPHLPLDIRTTVINGTEEDFTDEDIFKWQLEFIKPVRFVKLKGNHFFLFRDSIGFVKIAIEDITGSLELISKDENSGYIKKRNCNVHEIK